MSQEDGVELVRKCVKELNHRFLVNLPAFAVKVIDKDGVRELPDITTAALSAWFPHYAVVFFFFIK